MPRAKVIPEPEISDDDRRTQILAAALATFGQLGIARTSVQDVANAAGVSRGTVYRYFEDRQILVDAAIEYGAQRYYEDTAAAMARKETLAEQVGTMAEVVARTQIEQRTRNRLVDDDSELLVHIIGDSAATIRRAAVFLAPYVEAAKTRGEVARNLDVAAASEWLSRIIYSFVTVQRSRVVDLNKPKAVGRFVAGFAVTGLR